MVYVYCALVHVPLLARASAPGKPLLYGKNGLVHVWFKASSSECGDTTDFFFSFLRALFTMTLYISTPTV